MGAADLLGHVLHQGAAERHIHHLVTAADREQRDLARDRPAGQSKVEGILSFVDVVQRRVGFLPIPA
jgi:hypothetical protein